MNRYKTFEDLEFLPHRVGEGMHAVIEFDNGYGASVIFGTLFYSNGMNTYEIACLRGDEVCYPKGSSFEDDVVGHQTKEQITWLMKEIQDFPRIETTDK